jgi:IS30 family transposase
MPESVRNAYAKAMKQLPESLTLSLTYDRGKEMTEHKKLTMDTKIKVYFCVSHSPWQRGSNENINGLVREFWPKGTYFTPPKQIAWVRCLLYRETRKRKRALLVSKMPKINRAIDKNVNQRIVSFFVQPTDIFEVNYA